VYLVDDDDRVRQSIGGLLQAAGLKFVSFESASEFLAHSRVDEPSCLILDLRLPGISGLELQDELVTRCGPPVIFISGRGDVPSTAQAMKSGALEFLVKPVPAEVLLASVRDALARDKIRREQRLALSHLKDRYSLLSAREKEVLPLVVSGLMNKQSASILGIAEVTLQAHRGQIMAKMGAKSFAELVRMAIRLELPCVPPGRGSRCL
jgi:FixJ family two-component response regulator